MYERRFHPQFAYALGNPDDPDTLWKTWEALREADLPAAVRNVEDEAHRRELTAFLAGYRPLLEQGYTLGEAIAEEERLRAEGAA